MGIDFVEKTRRKQAHNDLDDENLKKVIGFRIMQKRKKLGILQKELAEAIGLTDNQISNIENGGSFPSMNNLLKICDALDITPDYLFVGTIRRRFKDDITDMISSCTPEEQKIIWLLIQTYIYRDDIT